MRHSHDPVLNRRHVVGVVADDLRLTCFPQLGQLLGSEGRREARVLEPEPITAANVGELSRDDTSEGRADHRAGQTEL